MSNPTNQSVRLADHVDVIEAQFTLSDFCLTHFPEEPQLSRAIQSSNSVAELRNALVPVYQQSYAKSDLGDALTKLITEINKTSN